MNEHILVVDDEAPIRDLLVHVLSKRGYQVSNRSHSRRGASGRETILP